MKIIVTGTIGTGKSTVVDILAKYLPDYKVISVDTIVNELYQDQDIKHQLIKLFGTDQKDVLSPIVFSDEIKMKKLKEIFDPIVLTKIKTLALFSDCIIEFPLFFKYIDLFDFSIFDRVVIVRTDELTQVTRASKRDNKDHKDIKNIISKQIVENELYKSIPCKYSIIYNNEELEQLEYNTLLLINAIKKTKREYNKTVGITTGSYDPITNGHIFVIEEALKVMDYVEVVLACNSAKKYFFTVQERYKLVCEALLENLSISDYSRICISILPEKDMLVQYAYENNIKCIFKGIRNNTDLDYEYQLNLINTKVQPEVRALYVLTPRDKIEISSSLIKGTLNLTEWEYIVSDYVPYCVVQAIKNKKQNI